MRARAESRGGRECPHPASRARRKRLPSHGASPRAANALAQLCPRPRQTRRRDRLAQAPSRRLALATGSRRRRPPPVPAPIPTPTPAASPAPAPSGACWARAAPISLLARSSTASSTCSIRDLTGQRRPSCRRAPVGRAHAYPAARPRRHHRHHVTRRGDAASRRRRRHAMPSCRPACALALAGARTRNKRPNVNGSPSSSGLWQQRALQSIQSIHSSRPAPSSSPPPLPSAPAAPGARGAATCEAAIRPRGG